MGGSYSYHNRNNDIRLFKKFFKTDDLVIKSKLLPPPSIIKIDVEGFEWEVFSGMLKVLKNYSPILIIEHSPPHLKKKKNASRYN